MSSNFLCFQLFCTKWWHLAPGKFSPQNLSCSQDIGTRILAILRHFLKKCVNLYAWFCLCLFLPRNHGLKTKIWIFIKLWDFISPMVITCTYILFSGFCESYLGELIFCGEKIMCKQGPGTEWSLKIQILFKNCFVMQPIMVAEALGLVQNVNAL